MRVGMFVIVVAEQRAAIPEQLHDDGIRAEHILALIFRQAFKIHAFVIERRVSLQAIFLSGIEVVRAVARSGVYDATALIERDVIGKNSRDLNIKEGVLKFHAFEIAPLERAAHFRFLDSAFRLQRRHAIGCEQ